MSAYLRKARVVFLLLYALSEVYICNLETEKVHLKRLLVQLHNSDAKGINISLYFLTQTKDILST